MNEAKEENLIYFSSYNDLVAANYICVGFLYEIRGTIYPISGTGISIYMKMEVKDEAKIGCVYQTVNTVRAWRSDVAASWMTITYTGDNSACGLGDSDWKGTSTTSHDEYATGYTEPTNVLYNSSGDATNIDTYRYTKVTYENGIIVSGHTGGYQCGNSLLIIGCKTGVSVTVADETTTTEGTTTKSVYDLDKGERTVTYTVDPTVAVVSENREVEDSDDTTNITVTVTLPKGLTYNYDATVDPYSITKNADGTTTIVWEFYDVTIGTSAGLEDITFSCLIGAAGTENDVQNNDTLTIAASITSDKDSREYSTANGNYSETTFSVIKLSSSSISKSVASNLLEVGEDITYELHYGNTASAAVNGVDLLDILPYYNDGRGTSYNGTYRLTNITADFSKAEGTYNLVKNSIKAYITNTDISSSDVDNILENRNISGFTSLGDGTADDTALTVTWNSLSLNNVKALYLYIGDVQANEFITIDITLSVVDDNGELLKDSDLNVQQPGDTYGNDFYQYATGQAAVVESNAVKATVVQRDLSGLVWKDADRDGICEDDEELYSGLTVSLYRTTPSTYATASETSVITIDGVTLYKAYNVLGQEIAQTTTDSNGSYSFTLLEAGTYYVVVSGGDSDPITDYGLTIQDSSAASSDNYDSDAAGTISGDTLQNAYIVVDMHATDEMASYHEVSSHNDAGLTLAEMVIKKVSESNSALSGAVFTLTDSAGNYYSFDGTTSITEVRLTTGNDGLIAINNLKAGTYTLTEVQAPTGYNLSTSTWTVTVKAVYDSTANSWFTQSYISEKVANTANPYLITNSAGSVLPETGGPGSTPFRIAGLLLSSCSAYLIYAALRRRRRWQV